MTAASSPSTTSARPREIEDPTNAWLIHRAGAALLAPAIRLGIHPNLVSLGGLAAGTGAAFLYRDWRLPGHVAAAFALMVAWHVLDGLDGQLARATGKTSAFGRFLDGVCDHGIFILIYIALVASLGGGATWIWAIAAGAAHVLQAIYFEGERASYIRRRAGDYIAAGQARAGFRLEAGYDWLSERLSDRTRPIDAALATGRTSRTAYLAAVAPSLKALTLLGANSRTAMIAIACLAGEPRLFWAYEIVGLSAVALFLSRRLRRLEAKAAA